MIAAVIDGTPLSAEESCAPPSYFHGRRDGGRFFMLVGLVSCRQIDLK
jgi:hypothetical protein